MKKVLYVLSIWFAGFGMYSCNQISCDTAMALVDLIYGSLSLVAPQGYAVGKTLNIDRAIKNVVASHTGSCQANSGDFQEKLQTYYRPMNGSNWQMIDNRSFNIDDLGENEQDTYSTSFTPQSPGQYTFMVTLDYPNAVFENNENNNLYNGNRGIGFAPDPYGGFDPKYIVTIVDPTGELKPETDPKKVKFTFGETIKK